MDETLRQLLDQLPVRAPRSKLEPHTEVIRVLRQKRRTYAEIAAFLREHLQLSVAPSTIHDFAKTGGQRFRVFSVIDAFTRECLALETDTSMPSRRVTRILQKVIATRGIPVVLRSDNGLNARGFFWSQQ